LPEKKEREDDPKTDIAVIMNEIKHIKEDIAEIKQSVKELTDKLGEIYPLVKFFIPILTAVMSGIIIFLLTRGA